jgi:hypothetical protein
VKRTKWNLDRGTNPPSSLTRNFDDHTISHVGGASFPQKSLDETKPANLYRDLKQKMSMESNKAYSSSSAKNMLRPNSVAGASNSNLLMKQHLQNKVSNASANQNRVDKQSLHEQFYTNPLVAPSVQSGGKNN